MTYTPPFHITVSILQKAQLISKELGLLRGIKFDYPSIKLRKDNTIKTIQASLAIEGNTLSLSQVTNLFDGKRVLGPQKDITEVLNAVKVYQEIGAFNPCAIKDLLKAHSMLMKDLVAEAGSWRAGGVGIFKGGNVTHVAPPAKRVAALMEDLFDFLCKDKETPWLIKACVFHYELEFIHPFSDGNGRMGRLWQQVLLMKEDPLFAFIPIEVLIKEHQETYYHVLGVCDQSGDSTLFIEFCLEKIGEALQRYSEATGPVAQDSRTRLLYFCNKKHIALFSRKDYMVCHKDISTTTASRDLLYGLEYGLLTRQGEYNKTRYQFIDA